MEEMNLICYRHNQYGLAHKLQRHELLYEDLTILLDGVMEYEINGESVTLGSGDIIFLRGGDVRARCEGHEKANYISFNFHSERDYDLPRLIKKGVSREIQHLLAACDEVSRLLRAESEKKIEHILHCMLLLLEERRCNAFSNLTEGILQYIHAHLAEKITLREVGREMHFSPVYCDTVFKKDVGKSIVSYLIEQRIEEAKTRLLENQESVSEIAHAVGFEDHNYFSRLFKQRVGYTPTQYQNSILKNYKREKHDSNAH